MINWLHGILHDPRRGWDPISAAYASAYGETLNADPRLIDRFGRVIGGYQGRRIVDLGSGPGQNATEFARRGAEVVCIDVSATYLSMAAKRMHDAGFEARFLPGYMDHVAALAGGDFDAAFSNVSWCYCMNDLTFARNILLALKPGGIAFIQANIDTFEAARSWRRRLIYWLNEKMCWKIGHPHPPRGRIAHSFRRLGTTIVESDYGDPVVDLVVVCKPTLPSAPGSSLRP